MSRAFTVLSVLCLLTNGFADGRRITKRIVGGSSTDIETIPYVLSLMVSGEYVCAAAILNERYGVTAAHCMEGALETPGTVTVRSGSKFWNKGGVLHTVQKRIVHEQYDLATDDYDLAVFTVDPPFRFGDTTKPVRLAGNRTTVDTSYGLVAGWGSVEEDVSEPTYRLRSVKVPKIPHKECVRDYTVPFVVTPREVCYGYRQGGADTCKGDSGGPLVSKETVLIGVTAWGVGCAEQSSPGVYTDTILLADWIKKRIR